VFLQVEIWRIYVGCTSKSVLRTSIGVNFFHRFGEGNSPLKCLQAFKVLSLYISIEKSRTHPVVLPQL
jgi:hypothetical protein